MTVQDDQYADEGEDEGQGEEDYGYDDGNADGGLTASSGNANGTGGGGEVDLLSMDDLSINDAPANPASVAAIVPHAAAAVGAGLNDLFGGGVAGPAQPQPVPKQVCFFLTSSSSFVSIYR